MRTGRAGDDAQSGTVQVLCSEAAGRKNRGREQGSSQGSGSCVERVQGSVGDHTDAGSLTSGKTGPVAEGRSVRVKADFAGNGEESASEGSERELRERGGSSEDGT